MSKISPFWGNKSLYENKNLNLKSISIIPKIASKNLIDKCTKLVLIYFKEPYGLFLTILKKYQLYIS